MGEGRARGNQREELKVKVRGQEVGDEEEGKKERNILYHHHHPPNTRTTICKS